MDLLVFPFIACLILVAIHVYFGNFVLKRGIIFIDLALAQWSALGYITGHFLHIENIYYLMGFSVSFTAIAAILLSLLKTNYPKTNQQEAVIGIVYVLGTALATGLIAAFGLEGHHLHEMLTGHMLFITSSELIFAALSYTFIGALMVFLHKHFLLPSKWDFLFYILFGCIVSSSVKMVGILLVFSFLVIPQMSISLFYTQFKIQLFFSWVLGILCCAVGLFVSLYFDISPATSIIYALCIMWFFLNLVKYFKKHHSL